MKRQVCWRKMFFPIAMIIFLTLFITACTPGNGPAPPAPTTENPGKYVYVNNNGTMNYVSAFAIGSDGTLTELSGSPYLTGGAGGGGSYASNDIALASSNGLLFASNGNDYSISVFSINKSDGTLTLVGSPVPSGGSMSGVGSLVVSPNEDYLFVANQSSQSISVFAVSTSGGLTSVTGSPFSIGGGADGIYINSSGNILYVADIFYQKIIALSVASDGSLSHITGSPFSYMASETLVASIILSSSTIGLVGTTDGMLSSYSIDATTGAPTLLHILSTGEENNQAVTTARDGSLAILSGGESPFISVVNVAADGTLTNVTGSPFSTSANTLGYAAANPAGTFLYATENTQIEGFSIDTNGVLTSLGTFPLTNANFARCLVIY